MWNMNWIELNWNNVDFQNVIIKTLIYKALPKDKGYGKPGRQMTVFVAIFNAAQWLIVTFEIQKVGLVDLLSITS